MDDYGTRNLRRAGRPTLRRVVIPLDEHEAGSADPRRTSRRVGRVLEPASGKAWSHSMAASGVASTESTKSFQASRRQGCATSPARWHDPGDDGEQADVPVRTDDFYACLRRSKTVFMLTTKEEAGALLRNVARTLGPAWPVTSCRVVHDTARIERREHLASECGRRTWLWLDAALFEPSRGRAPTPRKIQITNPASARTRRGSASPSHPSRRDGANRRLELSHAGDRLPATPSPKDGPTKVTVLPASSRRRILMTRSSTSTTQRGPSTHPAIRVR